MLELPLTVRLVAAVSTSPIVKGSAGVAVFSGVVVSPISVIVGGSFTDVTVSKNVSFAVSVPSETVTVMVAVPF